MSSSPIVIAAALVLAGSALCQQAVASAATDATARAERAIADYEATRGDPAKAAQQNRALLWLGEVDHPTVTDYLQRELTVARDSARAATVLDAIARVPRPGLQQDLWDALHRAAATPAVRYAAAKAIVLLGDRGVDRLVDLVRTPEEAASERVWDAAVGALVDVGGDRAHRGLAPMLLQGPPATRVRLLRRMESVRGVAPVSLARIQLVRDGDLETAAVAWRQLAVEGHDRARALAIDMLERLIEAPRPAVAAELIGGIVLVRDADLYPVLLRFGTIPGEVVRRALRAASPAAAQDRALVEYLIKKGLEHENPGVREVAKVLLTEAPAEAVGPLLTRVRKELHGGKKKSLDLAIGLHAVLARDPAWRSDLLGLANSKDAEVRVVGLALLLELGADNAIAAAQQSLGHKAWEVRSTAYRYLTRCRDTSSIPLLIARVEREEGRLAHELANALFAHTGTRCWRRKEWEEWWEQHRTGFVLPHPESVKAGVGAGTGKTISYHGIPLVSSRVAFLVDTSGSMAQPMGTDRKWTRLDAAREQLTQALEALPAATRCNLMAFDDVVVPTWDKLRPASDENRREILAQAKKLAPGRGTNIFDSLDQAFRDTEVDTIYLLTDGTPTLGRLTNVDDILDEVRRWNVERQIVVHCIGLGIDSDLLKRLAEQSGGTYRYVK